VSHYDSNLADTPETPETPETLETVSHYDSNLFDTPDTLDTLDTLGTQVSCSCTPKSLLTNYDKLGLGSCCSVVA